jgi:ribose transport system ATP-binding protein
MTIISLQDVAKTYGPVQALREATLDIAPGECIGLVGHNGAGKSTLINILTGAVAPTSGRIHTEAPYTATTARSLGIRCVSQELSLCPNLTVAENTRLIHPRLRGFGWRKRAGALIEAALDEVFPNHGIAPGTPIADLTLTQRQMVENARAFTATDIPPRLVILDEPTSSLDAATAAQLLAHVRTKVGTGLAVLFVSHMLDEVLRTCDRVIVMSEGRIVARRPAQGLTRHDLVSDMGAGIHADRVPATAAPERTQGQPLIHARPRSSTADRRSDILEAYAGEVVGLGGLAGHGQTDFLVGLFDPATMALVAGDRQRDGVFPLWSVGENIAIGSMRENRRAGLLDRPRLNALANDWRTRMEIRVPNIDAPILSLSGGNQQKALFARALASRAKIILMDDPMRGVDVATKVDVYAMIRAEAAGGRTFLWYTTEMDELYECDRVTVFREGIITASLDRNEVTEQRVLQASF